MNYRDPQKNLKITQNLFSTGFFYEITVKELNTRTFCFVSSSFSFWLLDLKVLLKRKPKYKEILHKQPGRRKGRGGGQGSMTGLIYALHLSKRTYKQ